MSILSVDAAWQAHLDRRERLMTLGVRRRRLRPQPPVDRLPGRGGPDRAA